MRGGEEPPQKILADGNYKFDTAASLSPGQYFVAYKVVKGRIFVFAESLGGTNNINIYGPSGAILGRDGNDAILGAIRNIGSSYDNFVEVTKQVNLEQKLADFENYVEL